jgi:hypothetical protein
MLKKQKLQEIRLRKKKQRQMRSHIRTESAELEKIYAKDIDEFLEDSDWDIESMAPSTMSRRTSRSNVQVEGRLRGLESIYLQRIDTSMKGNHQKPKQKKPKFRHCQDRVINDPSFLADEIETRDDIASIIEEAKGKKFGGMSARTPSKL